MSAKIYVKKTKHQHLGAAASPLGFSFGMDSWCRFPPLSGFNLVEPRPKVGMDIQTEGNGGSITVKAQDQHEGLSLSPQRVNTDFSRAAILARYLFGG